MPALLVLSAAVALGDGWGDEPAVLDGFRRVTDVALVADAGLRGRRVYLDGKFGGVTRERMLLRASRVRLFKVGSRFNPEAFGACRHDTNVRVFGVAGHDAAGPTIQVERIDRLSDDAQRYAARRAAIPPGDAEALAALADRLRARARRYGVRETDPLRRWAREVSREAIETRARAATVPSTGTDPAAHIRAAETLYELAQEALRLVDDAALRDRLVEQGLTAERRALPPDRPGAYIRLAEKWDRLLPGGHAPAVLRRRGLEIERARLPAGNAASRFALAARFEQLLGDEGASAALKREGLRLEVAGLAPDDHEGRYRLSRRIAEVLGDAEWSRSLLAEGAAIERAYLESAEGRRRSPPTAYFNLARRYGTDLNDAARRKALVLEGLRVQEERLDPRDLNGHYELALAYLAWLGDRTACTERLVQCLGLVRDEPRVRAKLAELGMVEVAGRWYEREAVRSDPRLTLEAKFEAAVAAGRIEVGMTPSHVRRAWGESHQRNAVYTRNARTIIWTYPGIRPTRVTFRNGRVVDWSR